MNAVEIEQAVSELAESPFDAEEFPFAFLTAFGNKATTLKRLRTGTSNKSDVGGVLQTNNAHLKVCAPGSVADTLSELRESRATAKGKVKVIVATDGRTFEAEDLNSGETVACEYPEFADHFGFFLSLAGISTVKQIRESAFDIKATGRLNRLYVQLLKDNPDWGTAEKREEMNHFMARLIFCFFAEDTDIFRRPDLFTETIERMSDSDASNTHEIIMELFRSMNTKPEYRDAEKVARWAGDLPYVNGGLFAGSSEVPKFTRIARSYLVHIGGLDWKKINPDIFGSMIQAVADDEERGELGMHYTSVPNILKVLNPLFLDELREQLEEAGDNGRKLLNLRNRIAKIRVFDPACGSGNFLVIAYKEMRAIEAEINKRRGELHNRSVIPVTNFRGIEIRDFSAEVARLALIIAEYQSDVLYRGQREALQDFLPLRVENWITCANALQIDWLSVCPPTGTDVQHRGDDLFLEVDEKHEVDFENEGGETYICGNPPYLGSVLQSPAQKSDLKALFEAKTKSWKSLDLVSGWFAKAADYATRTQASAAFVSTNSICQGEQVPILWPIMEEFGASINFAHTNFKWSNLAAKKAGVTVIIVGISNRRVRAPKLFWTDYNGVENMKCVDNINAYLIAGINVIVKSNSQPISHISQMIRGNMPNDGGHLLIERDEARELLEKSPKARDFVRMFIGAREFTGSTHRYCLWIKATDREIAERITLIKERIDKVHETRVVGGKQARDHAHSPHRFVFAPHKDGKSIAIPAITSENRDYLPVGIFDSNTIVGAKCYVIYGEPLWNLSMIASRLHWVWIGTVCSRMRTDFSYSNTLGWNTFPAPTLTEKNKADLTRCAENILLAREAHFPKTIADLYAPDKMPANLKEAHEQNDEVLERIYIGRRFKNDTERLEKLFELYTKMTSSRKKAVKA
jgi:hypothetical protein